MQHDNRTVAGTGPGNPVTRPPRHVIVHIERYMRGAEGWRETTTLPLVWLSECYIEELKPDQRLQDHNIQERILSN
jgi:hypothetical protein